jgi:hypothetical protein
MTVMLNFMVPQTAICTSSFWKPRAIMIKVALNCQICWDILWFLSQCQCQCYMSLTPLLPLVPSLTFDVRLVQIFKLKVRNTWEKTSTSDYNNAQWENEIMWGGNCWTGAAVNRSLWRTLLRIAFRFVLKHAHWHVTIFMLDCQYVPHHLILHYYWSSILQGVYPHTCPLQSLISPLLKCDHFCCSRWISVTQLCQQLAATVTSPAYLLQTSFYSSSCPHWTKDVLTARVQNAVWFVFLKAEICMHGLSTFLKTF